MRRGYRSSDIGTSNRYADPKPRLVSIKQERREKEIRDELSGETEKKAVKSVTLPKFSWEK